MDRGGWERCPRVRKPATNPVAKMYILFSFFFFSFILQVVGATLASDIGVLQFLIPPRSPPSTIQKRPEELDRVVCNLGVVLQSRYHSALVPSSVDVSSYKTV